MSSRAKNVEAFLKSRLAHTVINHMDALTVGQTLGFSFKVLIGVNNHFVRAGLARQLGFFFRSCSANHPRTNILRHLYQQQPHASGSSVNQGGVAMLKLIRCMAQIMCGHALQHRRCRLLIADLFRNMDQPFRGHSCIFRVRADHVAVGNAIARLDRLYVIAYFRHSPGGFLSIDEGQLSRISALAKVNINKVHTGSRDLYHSFICFWLRDRQID